MANSSRRGPTLLLLLICALPYASQAANRLAGHPSPYLALHGDDPVDWQPWNDAVFERARADNRLVFVSIGYFSCHWCHVMQRESYRDAQVAGLINGDYVAVKVDRELDPDLDRRLIDFVEKIRGAAGWPLNVFLTPDGYPVTGFTYLPRDQFGGVLRELAAQWKRDHAKISAAARSFFEAGADDSANQAWDAPDIPAAKLREAFVSQVMLAADELQGGIGNTSKFPNVPQIDTLLEIIGREPGLDPDVADFARLTLHAMASRHLQDHVNGGFFRYTTDPDWQTPHYEKMLYDNAQLAALYLKAEELWPDRGYAAIAARTLDFVEAELAHADGGYMSSLSAVDSEDREGGAYLWSRGLLQDMLSAAEMTYLERLGLFESKDSEFLIPALIGPGAVGDATRNHPIIGKLRKRADRMPADDKRLAGWNAMMLDALVSAAKTAPRFAERAHRLYRDMTRIFFEDGRLIRFAGNADLVDAVFEDYAQVAHAFSAYGRRFEVEDAAEIAARLAGKAPGLFLKNGRWQQKARALIPMDRGEWIIPDLVFYSPMSLWLRVAGVTPGLQAETRDLAVSMRRRATREMLDSPYYYGSFILLRGETDG